MRGMTSEEKLLTRCLLLSGMHWAKAAFIVGTLQMPEVVKMLEYIAVHKEINQEKLYSYACELSPQCEI